MNGKIAVRHAAAAVLMIFIAAGAYLIGYKTAYDRMERAAASYETETFYAAITDRKLRNGNILYGYCRYLRQFHNGSRHGNQ